MMIIPSVFHIIFAQLQTSWWVIIMLRELVLHVNIAFIGYTFFGINRHTHASVSVCVQTSISLTFRRSFY